MPAAQLPAGRGATFATGGVVAPARVTLTTTDEQVAVEGNGGSYGEAHPMAYLVQLQAAIDLPFGERCRPGIALSSIAHNGLTGRCDLASWWTADAQAAWQVLAGPIVHVGTAVSARAGRLTWVAGIRGSFGGHRHVLELPARFAASEGFEPGMAGAQARVDRRELRAELPIGVSIDTGEAPFAITLVPYRVVSAHVSSARCDGCVPGVLVTGYDEAWGLGILVGFGGAVK